jgi:uridine kinase
MQHQDVIIYVRGYGTFGVPWGSTIDVILKQLSDKLPKQPVAMIVNHVNVRGLYFDFYSNSVVEFLMLDSKMGNDLARITTGFLLSKAVHSLFPGKRLHIKHMISNGMYCEIPGLKINQEVLISLTAYVQDLITQDMEIERCYISEQEAEMIFSRQGQQDQLALLHYRDSDTVHLFMLDNFYGYTYMEMLPRTGLLRDFRLIPYTAGLIYLSPEEEEKEFGEFWEQRKLAQIYQESKSWAEMLNIPIIPTLNYRVEHGEIDDIIQVNEALHEKKIAAIADMICSNENVCVVLIAGPSSSGKTTFAQRLKVQLRVNGRKAASLSMDNYFCDRANTPLQENGEPDYEALEALQLDLFNQDLQKLICSESVRMPAYNFITGQSVPEQIPMQLEENELLIIEGIHGLNSDLAQNISDQQKFKIYVSALTQLNLDYSNRISTTDCRLIRRIVRDNRTRGHDALQTIRQWPSVRRGENKHIFPFQENADVFFNSSLLYELTVLKPMVEPLLRGSRSEDVWERVEINRLLKFLKFINPAFGVKIPYNSIIREFIGDS